MSLDLGELVAYLVVDDKRWNFDGALRSMDQFDTRAKAGAKVAGDRAGEAFGDSLTAEAEQGGKEAGEKAGDGLLTKGRAGAAAAGAAVGLAFVEALNIDAGADKLVAQLDATKRQADRYGRVSGQLYAGAWGESVDEVNTAIASVVTSLDGADRFSGRRLKNMTANALDFASAFEVDIVRAVQVAGVVVDSGLAKKGEKAFDLLTKSSQKVPVALREDLLDAVEEYSQFFSTLGYTGPQAFAMLVDASEKGMYGIDKAGDAVKEFTIRSTDGSKASRLALERAVGDGNWENLENRLLKGGDTAQKATQEIIDGLLGIEDPAERAQTSIALFGTPLEDLNVRDIPDFLRSLKGTSDSMDDVRGATRRMSNELNDNAKTKFTEFKRTVETQFVGFFVDEVIPVLDDFAGWWGKTGGPALSDFADDVKPAAEVVGDMVDFFAKMPSEAKIASLVTLFGGVAALKMRGGNGGVLGTAGSALGLAKPVPVFVTNPGFGTPGTGVPGSGGKPNPKVPGWLAALGIPLAMGVGTDGARHVLAGATDDETASQIQMGTTAPGGGGFGAGVFDSDYFAPEGKKSKDVDQFISKIGVFQDALDLAGSTKVHPDLAVPGMRDAARGLADFIDLQIEAGRDVTTGIYLTGVESAMNQLATLNAGIDGLGERGIDNGVPYVHGGTRSAGTGEEPNGRGVTNHFHGDIRPYDSREFYKDVSKKSRRRGRGGFERP